jgi:glucokinase
MAGRLPAVVALAGGDPESVRGEDVTAAALSGDTDARLVVEQVGWWVGFGLANLACVLDPECIVLGGGLLGAGELWLDATRMAYAELVEGGSAREPVAIVPAAFGEQAGAVGAALAARQGGLW